MFLSIESVMPSSNLCLACRNFCSCDNLDDFCAACWRVGKLTRSAVECSGFSIDGKLLTP